MVYCDSVKTKASTRLVLYPGCIDWKTLPEHIKLVEKKVILTLKEEVIVDRMCNVYNSVYKDKDGSSERQGRNIGRSTVECRSKLRGLGNTFDKQGCTPFLPDLLIESFMFSLAGLIHFLPHTSL